MDRLRKCQLLQLSIAKEVVKLCDVHSISYLLIAGSMLGAVRHNGFIPWDDDLDIGMTRENYDRFLEIAKTELPSNLFVQTWVTDANFALPIAKIRLYGTKYVEKNSKNVNINDGIYIDIFPFDNVPNNDYLMHIQRIRATFYKHILLNKCNYNYIDKRDKKKYLLGKIFRLFSHFMTLNHIHRKYYSIITRYNYYETERLTAFGGASTLKKETLKRSWVEKTTIHSFEDTKLNISQEWDKYLKHFYGDYLTPPPENIRYVGHSITEIDFGSYAFDNIGGDEKDEV